MITPGRPCSSPDVVPTLPAFGVGELFHQRKRVRDVRLCS